MPHEGMAGLQIRWRSVGRAAAIGAAAIAGIVSLPALLGSDKPPPVPADVGLVPAQAEPSPVTQPPPVPPASPAPSPKKRARPRLARGKPLRERSRPHRERSHPRHGQRVDHPPSTPAPTAPPAYTPPVYSYVPPPSTDEFGIER